MTGSSIDNLSVLVTDAGWQVRGICSWTLEVASCKLGQGQLATDTLITIATTIAIIIMLPACVPTNLRAYLSTSLAITANVATTNYHRQVHSYRYS